MTALKHLHLRFNRSGKIYIDRDRWCSIFSSWWWWRRR